MSLCEDRDLKTFKTFCFHLDVMGTLERKWGREKGYVVMRKY